MHNTNIKKNIEELYFFQYGSITSGKFEVVNNI